MLAIVREGSVLEALLLQLNCADVAAYSETKRNATIRQQLFDFFSAALAGFPTDKTSACNRTFFENEFLAPALTRRQCGLFEEALK